MAFLRAFGCVDSAYKKVRNGRCKGFKPAKGDGFAFHPHGVLTAPDGRSRNADDVSLASLPRLERALDRIQRGGGLKATHAAASTSTSTSTATRPTRPTGSSGVSATQQNTWLQRAAYQAWRDPRVKLFTQYLWRDEPSRHDGSYAGWQSGLRYADGRAKPSLKTLRDAVRARRGARPAVGPGPARATRAPSTCSDACAGSSTWRVGRDPHDRLPRLLELVDAPDQGRLLPLRAGERDQRDFEAQVMFPRGSGRVTV